MMVFGNPKRLKKLPKVNICVDGAPIEMVTSYKYLGVTLDGQLNYNKHVNKVIAGASLKLKQLKRMRSFLNTKAATLVYKNMILPIIEYGDIFLASTTAVNRKRLQVLQNKGLRCALRRDMDTSSVELHTEAKLLKLKYRRELHLLNFVFDKAGNAENLKPKRSVGVTTRSHNCKLFRTRKPKTEKFKKSVTYTGPKKWNALPADLQNIVAKPEFKVAIQRYIELKAQTQDRVDMGEVAGQIVSSISWQVG